MKFGTPSVFAHGNIFSRKKTSPPPHPLESLVKQEWGPQTIILFDAKWNTIFDKYRKSFYESRKYLRKFAIMFDKSRS